MPLLDRLERKLGWLAVPGLLRIIAGLQFLVYVMVMYKQDYLNFLLLDPELVREGEVWRLVSMCFVPRSLSVIWILFAIMFLIYVGDSLERAWGAFRLTLYYFAGVICLAAGAMLLNIPAIYAPDVLYNSIFLAFCVCFPQTTINLFGILPVRAWMLGLLSGGYLVLLVFSIPIWSVRLAILFGLLNFFVFAVPQAIRGLRLRHRVARRRSQFEANKLPPGEFFHQCAICGRTDAQHPELEFRVAASGDEYCSEHLPSS